MASQQSVALRVLCFGDSLTEGFTMMGYTFKPYSKSMKAMLEKQGNMEADVVTDGRSGELATAHGFEWRLKNKCLIQFSQSLYVFLCCLIGI
jgi:hypothetical protein